MRRMAMYALDWLFTTTHAATLGTKTLLLSADGVLPYELQVRARRPFKKGELFIAPWISPTGSYGLASNAGAAGAASSEATAKKTDKIVHPALRVAATITVRGLNKAGNDPRAKKPKKPTAGAQPTDGTGDDPTEAEENYCVQSPLVQGRSEKQRDKVLLQLSPFWAITCCGRSNPDGNNMVLKTVAVDFPPLSDIFSALPAAGKRTKPAFRVLIEIMTNTKGVKEGEVLTLPFPGAQPTV